VASTRRGNRSRYRLALLVLTAISLLTLDFRGIGPLDSAQTAVRDALDPVRRGLDSAFQPATNAWHGIWNYGDLARENEKLRDQVQQLQGEQLANEGAASTLRALQDELQITTASQFPKVVARVSSNAPGNFTQEFVEIDRGSSAGIQVGMAVVTGNGLIGRIKSVDRTRSTVELITSPDFIAGVLIDNELALAQGTGDSSTVRVRSGISNAAKISVGQAVLTSGQRSRFPPDIPIGTISAIEDAPTGVGRSVVIDLAGRPQDLVFVSVVLFTGAGEK
jgi:rod shape-determining protein MreC